MHVLEPFLASKRKNKLWNLDGMSSEFLLFLYQYPISGDRIIFHQLFKILVFSSIRIDNKIKNLLAQLVIILN